MNKSQYQLIKASLLVENKGQVEGLPKNPRFIKDERYAALKKSIQDAPEFLEARMLLVYPHEGKYVVIAGNMRLKACKELGFKELPCYVFKEDTPVAKLREYAIKDNVAFGDIDWDCIANEWDTKELEDWGMEVDFLTEEEEKTGKGEYTEVEDDTPTDEEMEQAPSRVKPGEIWQLGDHRLMCGDSTSKEAMAELMNGEGADLWLTDPPYNVNIEGIDGMKIANDNMKDEDFLKFLVGAYGAAVSVMKPGAAFYVCHADSEGYNFRKAAREVNLTVRECLIWNKNTFTLGRQDYQWKHEPILYGWKDGAAHAWYSDRKQSTVLEFDKPKRNGEHPTMKPVPLFAYLIENSSKAGDRVLDSFGGSGTTIVACEQLGRKGYAMELDPHYCDVIIDRWEKLTGKTAKCVKKAE